MGAWIETCRKEAPAPVTSVAPLWERGLKLGGLGFFLITKPVAPLWERGLKLCLSLVPGSGKSRSLMGAWIETMISLRPAPPNRSLPYGSVD